MAMRLALNGLAVATLAVLAGCVSTPEPVKPPSPIVTAPPPVPEVQSAAFTGLERGPQVSSLGISADDANSALAAFVESCDWVSRKDDKSGLTRPGDWQAACNAAQSARYDQGREFFTDYFETARIGDGEAFATGYFEPELRGSRTRVPGYDVPVYSMPDDLIRAWPDDMAQSERTGRPPLGRYDETGAFVPYWDREAIELGALAGRRLEIAWAADAIEFFFLQIQGSGLLRLPDGSRMRIGYAGQNGRGYTAIGRTLKDRGAIGDGTPYPVSMQGIVDWLRANPREADSVMRENQSWIFFRELTTDGPLGSIGVPVRARDSVAVDPRFVPYGAPVFLDMDENEADGLWIAQDTGGAIKGANRFDTFWGNGPSASRMRRDRVLSAISKRRTMCRNIPRPVFFKKVSASTSPCGFLPLRASAGAPIPGATRAGSRSSFTPTMEISTWLATIRQSFLSVTR